jgi:hypothetical protein
MGFGEAVAPLSALVAEADAFEECAGPMASFQTAQQLNAAVDQCVKVRAREAAWTNGCLGDVHAFSALPRTPNLLTSVILLTQRTCSHPQHPARSTFIAPTAFF